jgi:hypothetical protein
MSIGFCLFFFFEKRKPPKQFYRSPAISFPAIVVQLLVYPIGCFWAKVMPTKVFNTFGLRWTLNTGPFTIKEHTVVTVKKHAQVVLIKF